MENKDETFDEWFELLLDQTKRRCYKGLVPKAIFRIDYDCLRCPIATADIYIDEMQEFYN